MLTFTIHGKPQPKQRPRTVTCRDGKRRTYTPTPTKKAEKRIAEVAWANMMQQHFNPTMDPVGIEMTFYVSNMTSDIDNLMKTVLDGCNKIVWDDDKQVVECNVKKREDKDNQRTVVSVWRIAE